MIHKPVLLKEVVEFLITDTKGIYVDGTVGSGGHSEAIAEIICQKGGRLICIDQDPDAVSFSKNRLLSKKGIKVIKANYKDIDAVLENEGIEKVDGILLDLGMSSMQLEDSGRGFSFLRDEPLDMRMDPEQPVKAKDLVNNLSEFELSKIIKEYGEERKARLIAKAIIRERKKEPIESSLRLANIVSSAIQDKERRRHPATKTFQALRIAVNRELENLKEFLEKAPDLLKKRGRLVIISYHSLEDRLVKNYIKKWENPCICPPGLPYCLCGKKPLMKRIIKKGIKPSESEIQRNPRARSAILRIAERL